MSRRSKVPSIPDFHFEEDANTDTDDSAHLIVQPDAPDSEGSLEQARPYSPSEEKKQGQELIGSHLTDPVFIAVTSPEVRGGIFYRHFAYKVALVKDLARITFPSVVQDESVRHRFSMFLWLRAYFLEMYPGIMIPRLPPKKAFGNMEPNYVRYRMICLQRFMNQLIKTPVLRESVAFSKFINSDSDAFEEIKEELNDAKEKHDVVKTYRTCYADMIYTYCSADSDHTQFKEMREFLINCKRIIFRNVQLSKLLIHHYRSFAKTSEALGENLDSLSFFECQYEHSQAQERIKVIPYFRLWTAINKENMSQYHNYFTDVALLELDDIDAFLECLDIRDEINRRHQRCIYRVQKWDNIEVENDKQRMEKERDVEKEASLRDLNQCVSALVLLLEFPRLLESRVITYNDSIRLLSDGQISSVGRLGEMWYKLHEHMNISGI